MISKVPHSSTRHILGRPIGLAILVAYKGIWGLLEVIAGTLVLFSSQILSLELTEDPQDLLANWILARLGLAQAHQIGGVIIILGAIKLLIALGAWYRSWFMRNAALMFFSLAAIYGSYEISLHFTLLRFAALLADLFFIYYFWKVLPRHLKDVGIS